MFYQMVVDKMYNACQLYKYQQKINSYKYAVSFFLVIRLFNFFRKNYNNTRQYVRTVTRMIYVDRYLIINVKWRPRKSWVYVPNLKRVWIWNLVVLTYTSAWETMHLRQSSLLGTGWSWRFESLKHH